MDEEHKPLAFDGIRGAGVVFTIAATVFGVSWISRPDPATEVRPDVDPVPITLPTIPETNTISYGAWPAMSDPNYFASVRNEFIEKGSDFVEVDLSAMKLTVYTSGSPSLEVPVKTKGREGSWWETPSGLYRIGYKSENAFSSLGHVYMPWSMQFQGNFFIHGWPYYPDGTDVSSSYSGGCVRLATPDAEAVFKLVESGTPVLVHEDDFAPDAFTYMITAPDISAGSYLAADLRNNFILLAGNERTEHRTTVLPKVMTALIASEYRNIEQEVMVPGRALVETAKPRLSAGDTYRMYDLLWPLTLEDSAEAAETIASDFGTREFSTLLTQKLRSFGAKNTTIASPSGLGDTSYTTAEDAFMAAKYLYNNRPFLLSLSTGAQRFAYGPPAFDDMPKSTFPGEPDFVGGLIAQENTRDDGVAHDPIVTPAAAILFASSTSHVTGTITPPGRDAIVVFNVKFKNETRPIAFIVLDSKDPIVDITRMREYVKERYQ